jgi:hypothetical protein
MSTAERRLAKLEGALTPKQAALQWLVEARRHGSLRAFMETLRDAPDDAYPLVRLGNQMEEAVRTSLRGSRKPEHEVWQAVRDAVRDAGFLYFLVSQVNFRALEQRRANWLHIALVAEMLRTAFERDAHDLIAFWRKQAQEAVHEAYVQQGAAEAMARRYFDGTSPYLPDVETTVEAQVVEVERIVGLFNDLLPLLEPPKRKRKSAVTEEQRLAPIVLERERQEVQPAVQARMALIVDLAKSEAWRLIGERQKGYALLEPHVWPATP